jgi:hypothetical protein
MMMIDTNLFGLKYRLLKENKRPINRLMEFTLLK